MVPHSRYVYEHMHEMFLPRCTTLIRLSLTMYYMTEFNMSYIPRH